MQVEKININQIQPAKYNPRIINTTNLEKLKNNLQTYGLIDPLIIDLTDNNTLIGGHQRWEALKELNPEMQLQIIKLGDIGLVIQTEDLTIKDKNDQKAINLSLNNKNLQGEWDYTLLDQLLLELNENNYLIELTGFDASELIPDSNMFESDYELLDDIDRIYNEEKPNQINEDRTINNNSKQEYTQDTQQEEHKEEYNPEENINEQKTTIICPKCNHEIRI